MDPQMPIQKRWLSFLVDFYGTSLSLTPSLWGYWCIAPISKCYMLDPWETAGSLGDGRSSSRCNKMPQDHMAYKQQEVIAYSFGAWKSKIRVLAFWVSGETPLLGCRLVLTSSPGRRGRGAIWGPIHEGSAPPI